MRNPYTRFRRLASSLLTPCFWWRRDLLVRVALEDGQVLWVSEAAHDQLHAEAKLGAPPPVAEAEAGSGSAPSASGEAKGSPRASAAPASPQRERQMPAGGQGANTTAPPSGTSHSVLASSRLHCSSGS